MRFFADEVEQTTLDMEQLVVDFADEVEGLENEINKTAYAVENAAYQLDQTPFGPFDPSVDKMAHEIGRLPHESEKSDSGKSSKKFKPARNWDRLLKRMEQKEQKDDDVVKTTNRLLKPTTNWERILRKWDRNNKKIDPKLLKAQHGDVE